MATAPVKSQPLHNFSLPFLKWGGKNQITASHRFRRHASGDPSPADHHSPEPESDPEARSIRVGSRTSRNRFTLQSCYAGEKSQKDQHLSNDEAGGGRKREEAEVEETVQKPWNLRPRKTMIPRASILIGGGASRNGELTLNVNNGATIQTAQQNENPSQPKSLRLRASAEMKGTERKESRKVWIALSKEEIEEDIFIMTGSRPSRRPRKRPKLVQKNLDSVFPGLWMVGIAADAYRIADSSAKR